MNFVFSCVNLNVQRFNFKVKKSIFNSVFRWVKLLSTFSFKSIIKNSFGFFSDIMVLITNTSIQFDFPGMNPHKYLFKGHPLLNRVPGYNRFTTTFIYVLKILNLILLLYTSIGLYKSNAFYFSALVDTLLTPPAPPLSLRV